MFHTDKALTNKNFHLSSVYDFKGLAIQATNGLYDGNTTLRNVSETISSLESVLSDVDDNLLVSFVLEFRRHLNIFV